jgi:hypothetical protein
MEIEEAAAKPAGEDRIGRAHAVAGLTRAIGLGLTLALLLGSGCYQPVHPAEEITTLPITDLSGVVTSPGEGIVFDAETSYDGNGSLRIVASGPSLIVLYAVEQVDAQNAILSYQARVKTKEAKGRVFIELRVNVPEKGTFQSVAEQYALTGTSDWVMQEANFWLGPREVPSRLYLMINIEDAAIVWVDDIHVLKTPRET